MTETVDPNDCTHPTRGSQEHILSSGTGDYYCTACQEAMPIIGKRDQCYRCGSKSGRIEPDPEHGRSWRCLDCNKNWGWVYQERPWLKA